ncbi:MAG: sigma-70 family RNA polymerase sigma factor [Planctomycetes bacterium]|nr:sigma-70 family RNA polymerase sigma factor [Planctomycetota bacterium]
MSDADLIRAVQAGDEAALETLYERYLPSVWRYAFAQLAGHSSAAEDIVSETFLAAVRQVARLRPEGGSVGGWLVSIARHKIGDLRRQQARLAKAVATGGLGGGAGESDPSAPMESAETRGRVHTAMDALPDDQRLALEWKYVDGLSVREIADRMGRTEKAAETVLYRARGAFREAYERTERRPP